MSTKEKRSTTARLSTSIVWPIWIASFAALFLGASIGACWATYKNSEFIENQKQAIASLTGRTKLLTEALKNQSDLVMKLDQVKIPSGPVPVEELPAVSATQIASLETKTLVEPKALPPQSPQPTQAPLDTKKVVAVLIPAEKVKETLPVKTAHVEVLPAKGKSVPIDTKKPVAIQTANAAPKQTATPAANSGSGPSTAASTSAALSTSSTATTSATATPELPTPAKVSPPPVAPPTETVQAAAALEAGSRIEGVTQEKAGITKIWSNAIDFKSGLRVRVGEKFPSGETLMNIDGTAGRIVTDQRQILILDK